MGKTSKVPREGGPKRLWKALLLWLFGGLVGLHHVYLRRDRHAFVSWSTFGGLGLAWLADLFCLPRYVREANLDREYLEEFLEKLRSQPKPSFSVNRFTCAIITGYWWSYLFLSAIPLDDFFGINWKFLYWLAPIPATLGVWTVGNIGRQCGSPWLAFIASILVVPMRPWLADDTWITVMVFFAALAFDTYSKQWRRTPQKRRSICRRISILGFCGVVYISLWVAFFYFNGTITDSNGDEIPVHEALYHFFTSPWWVDLKQSLYDTYTFAQHHGWYQIWLQIVDLSDPHGEQNAYKVLGVGRDSSQQEITSAWRRLSRDSHPDKERDPELRAVAQQRFLEIQQAYNILSNTRTRRNRKNKKDNAD